MDSPKNDTDLIVHNQFRPDAQNFLGQPWLYLLALGTLCILFICFVSIVAIVSLVPIQDSLP